MDRLTLTSSLVSNAAFVPPGAPRHPEPGPPRVAPVALTRASPPAWYGWTGSRHDLRRGRERSPTHGPATSQLPSTKVDQAREDWSYWSDSWPSCADAVSG